jgi:predicted  nucleic acid-binding Zn-ribbon protein
MRSKISAFCVVVVVVLGAFAFGASVRGQEPARQDVMGTLLVEVRALRGAIEQMTSATARVQLAVGRLQIQEQRFNTLSRQLFEMRQTLSRTEGEQSDLAGRVADLEAVLPQTADAGERQAIAQEIGQMRRNLSSGRDKLQKLRLDENELSAAVAAEQGRWSDLNQQLDAIDQTLRR